MRIIEAQLPPGIPSPALLRAATRDISSWRGLLAGVILSLPGIPADPDSGEVADLARHLAALDARIEIIDVEFGHDAADHADLVSVPFDAVPEATR